MIRRHAQSQTLAATVVIVLLSGCGKAETEWVVAEPPAGTAGTRVEITGVVRHYELEGGFYAIRGDDSITYDPTNLPADFQRDGLRVEAEARRRDDLSGTRQVGPIVDLARIRRR